MIEFIRWQVKLALLAMRERARWRRFTFDQRAYNGFVEKRRLVAFLDRVSPFSYDRPYGYRWRLVRVIASRLAVPRLYLLRSFWRFAEGLLNRLAPYTGPGKFEGFADPRNAIKAEWLDQHNEYASADVGDVNSWGLFVALFDDLDVPWSRQPESWLLTHDAMGFVNAISFVDDAHAQMAFDQYAQQYHDHVAEEMNAEDEANRRWMAEPMPTE